MAIIETIIRLVIIVNSTKHICSGNKHTSTIEILIRTAITITMSSFWLHIIDVSTFVIIDKQMSPTDRCPIYTIVLRQTDVIDRQMSLSDNVTDRQLSEGDKCHQQTDVTARQMSPTVQW